MLTSVPGRIVMLAVASLFVLTGSRGPLLVTPAATVIVEAFSVVTWAEKSRTTDAPGAIGPAMSQLMLGAA